MMAGGKTEAAKTGARLRSILESSYDGILLVDEGGHILIANAAMERITGYTHDELIGMSVDRLVPSDPSKHTHQRALFARHPEARPMGRRTDLTLLRSDGSTCPVEIALGPATTDEGLLVTAVVRDLTEKRALESQLLQSQKLEAVGKLAGGVAHDFNNLLTSMISFTSFVRDDLPQGDERREDLNEVLRAAERAAALTNQLLSFSRQQPTQPRIIDVGDSLKSIERLLQRTIGENVQLTLGVTDEALCVFADATHLDQVIINLAVNARDAMPLGGTLRISAAAVRVESGEGAESPAPGRYVRLEISDSGVGMDATTKAHVFEPFFTTKAPGSGTGLGLATCYGAVKQMGGTIEVDSTIGQGTTFVIHLPLRLGEKRGQTERAPQAPETLEGSETILVIEDELAVRRATERALKELGYRVLLASDGVEGIEVFERNKGQIDLVLSDVVLPRGSGFHVADVVRQQSPNVAVLLASGYPARMIEDDLPGSYRILRKPFTVAVLARRIRACLNERE